MNFQVRGEGRALSVRLIGALGLVVSAGLLLVPASASALAAHPFLETFGSSGQPSFLKPEGLAVDQANGDLL